jgi:hypothetical protein
VLSETYICKKSKKKSSEITISDKKNPDRLRNGKERPKTVMVKISKLKDVWE